MDFLEIRRKAKERAAARAAAAAPPEQAAGPESGPGPGRQSPPPLELEPLPIPSQAARDPDPLGDLPPLRDFEPPPEPPPDPEAQRRAREAAAEVARLEAAFEAKLKELPTAPDARFRTWRPSLDPIPGPPAIAPEADDERARAEPTPPERRRRDRPPIADPLEEFFYRLGEPGPELSTLAPSEEAPSQAGEVAPLDEYLTFLLGEEEFGVEIGRVREVMRAPPITEVPRAPADVLGVITVRGDVVAVIDLRGRLGLPGGGSVQSGRVIIVDDGQGAFGLQVDGVSNVVRLPRGSLEPCPQGMGGVAAECLVGIGRSRDRLFTVLAVPTLLRPARRAEGRA
jgi:purine-binding chemotaxis protein CheW